MELSYIDPPPRVRIPIASGLYLEKLFREARVERAWTLGSDKNVHISFKRKARMLSVGIAQLMTDPDGISVAVVNVHVGPWSPKDTIAIGLERAGAQIETHFKNELTATFLNNSETKFLTVTLRR